MIKKMAIVLAVLLAASFAHAETMDGSKELGFNISAQNHDAEGAVSTSSTTMISVLYGYFLTSEFEVGGAANILRNEMGSTDSTQTGFDLQARYHFTRAGGMLLPYLGIQSGYSRHETSGSEYSGLSYGILAGAKYFMNSSSSVNFEYNVRKLDLEESGGSKYKATVTTFSIGYSIYFSGS